MIAYYLYNNRMIYMKRKLVKQGVNALTVSLPAKWIKKNSLQSGVEIDLEEVENSIVITPENTKKPIKRVEVDISDMDSYIQQLFATMVHKKGYDEILVRYKDPKQLKAIRERMDNLLGFEIVEQDNNKCLIKNISGDNESEYDSILRRSFLVTKNMFENIVDSLNNNDFSDIDSILELEKTNNRLTNYCERILVKYMNKGNSSFVSYVIIWNIESIADDLRDFLRDIKSRKSKPKFSKQFASDFSKVSDIFADYYNLFYNFSVESINKLKADVTSLKKELLERTKKSKEEGDYYFYITIATSRIYDLMASTMSLQLEGYIKDEKIKRD